MKTAEQSKDQIRLKRSISNVPLTTNPAEVIKRKINDKKIKFKIFSPDREL